MKIKNIFLLAVLVRAIFIFTACNDWDGSDNQGSIVISFGSSKARVIGDAAGNDAGNDAPVSVYAEEADKINKYTITLTSPGKKDITQDINKDEKYVSIPVSEGAWSVLVKGEGDRVIVSGKANVNVSVGQTAAAVITMNITGTSVSSEEQIKADFVEMNKGKDGKLEYLEEVEILDSFTISETNYDKGISLNSGNSVTLWSKKDVTLTRSEHGRAEVDATVFKIDNGTLVLDGTKGGTITIDGNKENNTSCKRALINVNDNKEKETILIIRDGVTLTNNTTDYGGGVHVMGSNSYFYMYGGVISGNSARNNGGGVYVKDKGHFEKTGGIIYGSDQEEDSLENNTPNHGGDAVYYNETPYNNTSSADDKTFAPK